MTTYCRYVVKRIKPEVLLFWLARELPYSSAQRTQLRVSSYDLGKVSQVSLKEEVLLPYIEARLCTHDGRSSIHEAVNDLGRFFFTSSAKNVKLSVAL